MSTTALRLSTCAALPYLLWLVFARTAALRAGAAFASDAPALSASTALTIPLVAFISAAAAALWSSRRALRVAGYVGHAIALAFGFGLGIVLAVSSALGPMAGDEPRLGALPLAFGIGAVLAAACLLPLAGLVMRDLREAR